MKKLLIVSLLLLEIAIVGCRSFKSISGNKVIKEIPPSIDRIKIENLNFPEYYSVIENGFLYQDKTGMQIVEIKDGKLQHSVLDNYFLKSKLAKNQPMTISNHANLEIQEAHFIFSMLKKKSGSSFEIDEYTVSKDNQLIDTNVDEINFKEIDSYLGGYASIPNYYHWNEKLIFYRGGSKNKLLVWDKANKAVDFETPTNDFFFDKISMCTTDKFLVKDNMALFAIAECATKRIYLGFLDLKTNEYQQTFLDSTNLFNVNSISKIYYDKGKIFLFVKAYPDNKMQLLEINASNFNIIEATNISQIMEPSYDPNINFSKSYFNDNTFHFMSKVYGGPMPKPRTQTIAISLKNKQSKFGIYLENENFTYPIFANDEYLIVQKKKLNQNDFLEFHLKSLR